MENALYVGLSRQMTLRRQLDIVANNIANADTTGFKVEQPLVQTEPRAPARSDDGPNPIKFVLDNGLARDFSQGSLKITNATFDLAIDGPGFFQIATPAGDRFTRDDLIQAVKDGARLRLRPKVMTVATIVASLLPIFWSHRTGAEVMKPLATPVIGGMVSSLLHILIVTPILFVLIREREFRK